MSLRIGIDFDNTIACYDSAFSEVCSDIGLINDDVVRSKQEVKQHILKLNDGNKLWQSLQGQVYGKYIKKAYMFPGLSRFLMRSLWKKNQIYIISHKTEFGHYDESGISLREACRSWLSDLGFFDSEKYGINKQDVFFADTRFEKVSIIKELNLDYMVDDLAEVFEEKNFPIIKKILFSSKKSSHTLTLPSWDEISREILGPLTEAEVGHFFSLISNKKEISHIHRVHGGRNSQVFKIQLANQEGYCIKFYPSINIDGNSRQTKECFALNHLAGDANIPELVFSSFDLGINITKWIDGKKISSVSENDIKELVSFVATLKKKSKALLSSSETATEACFSADDIIDQLNKRKEIFENLRHPYVEKILHKIFNKTLPVAYAHAISFKPVYDCQKPVDKNLMILSPSDMGFHNAIRRADNSLSFLDFEYFGLDDPVKLLSDTLWHPGMSLSDQEKIYLSNQFIDLFLEDAEFKDRLKALWPLYGLRWSLIVLNAFRDKKNMENSDLLRVQYSKALSILKKLDKTGMVCPYVH
jgi:hypothetical protein